MNQEMEMLSYCMVSNKGNREINVDSARIVYRNNKTCFIVADAMEWDGKGECASSFVTESMANQFNDSIRIESFLEIAVVNTQIRLMEKQKNTKKDMKSTVAALLIDGDNAKWIHVGNSRLYSFKKTRVKEKTVEDNEVLIGDNWETTQYSVSNIRDINKINAFLLCTDGFWKLINEKEIRKALKKSTSVREWLDYMQELINKNGEEVVKDNYTAIAVWI
jgi:serine/threonine protein phosphatase PrpC